MAAIHCFSCDVIGDNSLGPTYALLRTTVADMLQACPLLVQESTSRLLTDDDESAEGEEHELPYSKSGDHVLFQPVGAVFHVQGRYALLQGERHNEHEKPWSVCYAATQL